MILGGFWATFGSHFHSFWDPFWDELRNSRKVNFDDPSNQFPCFWVAVCIDFGPKWNQHCIKHWIVFFDRFFWNLDHLGYKKGAEMDPTAPQKRAPKHTRKRAPKRETFATMFGPFFGRENAVTSRTTNGIGSKDRIWRP